MSGAEAAVMDTAIDQVVVTDSVPAFRLGAERARAKVNIVSVAPLLAECIRRPSTPAMA